ncbi:MAG: hypothetical protein J0L92_21980 [Deltaproteobacteria bacterium]|nr:hypothetical protein [Deltaproteobacteria bacterium]
MISRRAWIAGVFGITASPGLAAARFAPIEPIGPTRTIAVLDAPGVGPDALSSAIAAIEASPALRAVRVTPRTIVARVLRSADALLVTGGRGSRQGRALGEDGRAEIRRFVRDGGGYVGICAGSYLAMQVPIGSTEESYKAAFVAAAHATGDAWQRGIAPIEIVSPEGARATLHYANGPLFSLVDVEGLPTPRVLARFVGEVSSARGGTLPGQMRDAPALIATSYGRGQVVLFSPNPTLEPAVPTMLTRALSSVASGDPVTSLAQLT